MPDPAAVEVVSASGYLLVLSLVVPVAGTMLAFAAGGRHGERIALLAAPTGLAIAVAIVAALLRTDRPLVYFLGGWAPPLGVPLRGDGAGAVMMVVTAIVVCAVTLFARGDLRTPAGEGEARQPFAFWILLLGVWGALNMVFIAGDLFALYVALELLTFAAVPLVCLDGRAETIASALRYLLFTLPGSILYLLGAVLIYGATGTLDNVLVSQRIHAEPATLLGAALMTVGLLAKTALFPLHMWLPPAHAGARPFASAVLSALVVKGPWFIVVRLWFDVFPGLPGPVGTQLLAGLGAAAIVFGSVLALRQARLKLVIAYSTLAQIGYLFLMFSLAFDAGSAQLRSGGALAGGILQAISHATAKASMFMAAGLVYTALGHDRIAGLGGTARALPVTVLAFALGGVALIGLPPSGAYLAKDLLLEAAGQTQQWWWTLVIQSGGFFTSSYLVLVLAHALAPAREPIQPRSHASLGREVAVLALALCSLGLGLVPWQALLPLPPGAAPPAFSIGGLWKGIGPVAGGVVIAILLGRWGDRPLGVALAGALLARLAPARRVAVAFAGLFERVDRVLRQWPAASLSMLGLTIALFGAMLAGNKEDGMLRASAVGATLAMAVTAAADPAGAATPALEGPVWRLTELRGLDPEALAAVSAGVTVRFEAGRIQAFAGCNRLAGGYVLERDVLKVGQLAGTLMACPPPQMAVETAFKNALAGALRVGIDGERLTLTPEADPDPRLVFEMAPPPRLEGITWEVTGFNNGRQAVVSPVVGTTLTVSFQDGTVTGNAGCNSFRATYTREGDRLAIGPAAATRMHCEGEGVMEQERQFLAALASTTRWAIDRDMLDLHRADGERVLMAGPVPK